MKWVGSNDLMSGDDAEITYCSGILVSGHSEDENNSVVLSFARWK
jgi:hypothetical protein